MAENFQSPVDIANRACQHVGVPLIDPVLGFTEVTAQAQHTSFAYAKLRRSELRRNVWRFATRKAALRPIDTNTVLLAPALWSPSTSYFVGSIVIDQDGYRWISRARNNLNNQPSSQTNYDFWEPYFGPLTVALYDSSKFYFAGELVYTAAGDGTYNTYLSQVNTNAVHPALPNLWSTLTTYFMNQVVGVFPAWSSGTTYTQGQSIAYTDGNVYSSLQNGNLNHIPSSSPTFWALMPTLTLASQGVPITIVVAPPQYSPVLEWSQTTAYVIGNFVMFNGTEYVAIANNSGRFPNSNPLQWAAVTGGTLYMSLIDLNIGNNPANAPPLWSNSTTYAIGNKVGGSDGVIYSSLTNGNIGNDPTTDGGVNWQSTGVLNPWTTVFTQGGGNQQWMQIGGASFPAGVALTSLNIIYPLNTGPVEQTSTRNAFRLPAGYLRRAHQNPKAGAISLLGAPGALPYTDWEFENNYIVSSESMPIVFRFVADVTDVRQMDDLYCEMLAAEIAKQVCEPLTQSAAKLQSIIAMHKMTELAAKAQNAIEVGAEEPAVDDYISCRA